MSEWVNDCVRVGVRACMRACMCVRIVCACVRLVRACVFLMHACVRACVSPSRVGHQSAPRVAGQRSVPRCCDAQNLLQNHLTSTHTLYYWVILVILVL